MPNTPFVINDRRKFTSEGDLRPDAPPSEPKPIRDDSAGYDDSSARLIDSPAESSGPHLVTTPEAEPALDTEPEAATTQPPPLTADQIDQATRAYHATVERLDTAIRAANPGMEQLPEMTFDRLVQSLYMQALIQLGGTTEQGQTPQVDLLGARQTIDMLDIFAAKTKGNLSDPENQLVESALFELRMGFLEITQALARQAASRQPGAGPAGSPLGGPSIVR